jgi:glycosyltransferase involved in cell wall biosynthesis
LIYDIFPDALVDAGVMSRKSIVCTLWKKMNIKAYAKTKTIFTISDGMKQVLTQYVTESKIKVVPVWADNEFLKPINVEENIFIQKNNLSGKFIVLYSGNLGKTGDIDCMVEFAKQTKDTDIHYLIIGGGVKSAAIEKSIRDNNLSNCTLLPWQNSEMLPFSLSAASLAVVSLGKNTSKIAMPSKLYSYLAVGAPVLSLSSNDSDLAKLVTKRDFGKNFEPDKIAEIVKFILFLRSNKVEHSKFHLNSLETSSLFTKSNAKLFIEN